MFRAFIWASLCSPAPVISSGHLGQTSVGACGWFQHGSHLPSVLRGAAAGHCPPRSPMVCPLLRGARLLQVTMETGRPGPRGALGLLKGTVLGAGGEPRDNEEAAGARGVPEPLSCSQSSPKLYPSHPSSKRTSNPPEPLLLQPRPRGVPPFPTHSTGPAVLAGKRRKRNLGDQARGEGLEGWHRDGAIFVCQAQGSAHSLVWLLHLQWG